MTYITDNINKLPKKWSISFMDHLFDMQEMVKTIKFIK
jgi:hypothetical protein